MLTAMGRGVRAGWLEPARFTPVIELAWRAVLARVGEDGTVRDVCTSTGAQATLEFPEPVPASAFDGVEGVHDAEAEGTTVTARYEGAMAPLLAVATSHGVLSLNTATVDLDEMFLEFYREDGNGADESPAA